MFGNATINVLILKRTFHGRHHHLSAIGTLDIFSHPLSKTIWRKNYQLYNILTLKFVVSYSYSLLLRGEWTYPYVIVGDTVIGVRTQELDGKNVTAPNLGSD